MIMRAPGDTIAAPGVHRSTPRYTAWSILIATALAQPHAHSPLMRVEGESAAADGAAAAVGSGVPSRPHPAVGVVEAGHAADMARAAASGSAGADRLAAAPAPRGEGLAEGLREAARAAEASHTAPQMERRGAAPGALPAEHGNVADGGEETLQGASGLPPPSARSAGEAGKVVWNSAWEIVNGIIQYVGEKISDGIKNGINCALGFYNDGLLCKTCEGGAIENHGLFDKRCVDCPPGYYRAGVLWDTTILNLIPQLTETCTRCRGGATRRRRAPDCTACPGGHFSARGQDDCVPCLGEVERQYDEKTTACRVCPPGNYKPKSRWEEDGDCVWCNGEVERDGRGHAVSCKPCSKGMFKHPDDLSDSCSPCVGRVERESGSNVAIDCHICPLGYFKRDPNDENCTECVGEVERDPQGNARDCLPCPEGLFNDVNSDTCVVRQKSCSSVQMASVVASVVAMVAAVATAIFLST